MNFIFFMPDGACAPRAWAATDTPLCTHAAHGQRWPRREPSWNQCHVQHSVCTPSRCSLMTGWYPHVRGHRTLWHMLRPDEPNLFRYLKQAGYTIHWYGKNDTLSPENFPDSVDVAGRGSGMFHPESLQPGQPGVPKASSTILTPGRWRNTRLCQCAGGH